MQTSPQQTSTIPTGDASGTERIKLLSGRLLARNSLWNMIGYALPLTVAVVAIPLLIKGMGKERFGLLGIIWMGIGYFSLFDMGLARALTKLIAERLGRNKTDDLPDLVWTGMWLILAFGLFGLALGIGVATPLVADVLNVPEHLREEGALSFCLLALSIPVVIMTSAFIAVLEAHQRFAVIAAVRVPLGVMTFLGPLITVQYSPSLVTATTVMLLTRIIVFGVYFSSAARALPLLKRPQLPKQSYIRPLLSFGGWITVSNVVGPFMGYIDRFFVGAFLNLIAVAYYITPYDMLSRLQILPQAVLGVFFPALTAAIEGDRQRLPLLYGQMGLGMFLLLLPIVSAIFFFAPEILQLWLGSQFRDASSIVVKWLALGWMISFIGNRAFMILQSAGRPDITGKVHIFLLAPYALVLWQLTKAIGIEGTAIAWTLQRAAQTIILNLALYGEVPDLKPEARWDLWAVAVVATGSALTWSIGSLPIRCAAYVVVLAVCAALCRPLLEPLLRARRY